MCLNCTSQEGELHNLYYEGGKQYRLQRVDYTIFLWLISESLDGRRYLSEMTGSWVCSKFCMVKVRGATWRVERAESPNQSRRDMQAPQQLTARGVLSKTSWKLNSQLPSSGNAQLWKRPNAWVRGVLTVDIIVNVYLSTNCFVCVTGIYNTIQTNM